MDWRPKNLITLSFLLIAYTQTVSSQEINVSIKSDEQQVRHALRNWPKIGATEEIDKMMYYFADDAIIMGPGQPTVKGKPTIQQMMAGMKNIPGLKLEWDTEPSSVTASKWQKLGMAPTARQKRQYLVQQLGRRLPV